MTDTASSHRVAQSPGRPSEDGGLQGRGGKDRAPQDRGKTTIADSVVEKIAGMAAREIQGVHALGAGMTRTLGAMRDRVPGGRPSVSRGVTVEVGERQAAVDLDIVVEYGVPITDLAGDIRTSVISAVERMTGLEVVEVNVAVDDVHLPDEDDDEGDGGEGRVT
ncbi:Asp23/Gls24 family envelope stress response protein [Kitasatospora sp. NPDC056138]|uniref:Asp23/Gls24 family envelope stress response protein n=1 Tax=Kitasatospora sp. NPDC056138 TaxID=3345724 RepID=UPI0035D6FFD3